MDNPALQQQCSIAPIFSATVPLPPSTNNLYVNARKGRVKSKHYADWGKYAAWKLALAAQNQGWKCTTARVGVILEVQRPNGMRDLDNTQKCIFDALQGIVYKNDNQISAMAVCWGPKTPDGHAGVRLYEASMMPLIHFQQDPDDRLGGGHWIAH